MDEGRYVTIMKVALSYARTEREREAWREMGAAMARDMVSEDGQVRAIAGAIHDGLAYGNWPWTK